MVWLGLDVLCLSLMGQRQLFYPFEHDADAGPRYCATFV